MAELDNTVIVNIVKSPILLSFYIIFIKKSLQSDLDDLCSTVAAH